MVARVREAYETDRAATEARLDDLGVAAAEGARALQEGSYEPLGRLMSRAHQTLAALGVSAPVLDRIVDAAHTAGALGAKLSGAGGGGAVIALAPGREESVLEAWRALGYECFACAVGVRGIDAGGDGGRT
jgi:mevalonate kinase